MIQRLPMAKGNVLSAIDGDATTSPDSIKEDGAPSVELGGVFSVVPKIWGKSAGFCWVEAVIDFVGKDETVKIELDDSIP